MIHTVLQMLIDRFNMQKISWWDWPEHVISEQLDKIMSKDISAFIAEYLPEDD